LSTEQAEEDPNVNGSAKKSGTDKPKKFNYFQTTIQITGAFAAIIAAAVTLAAFVFSTPHNLNDWFQVTYHRYSVAIKQPQNNAGVGNKIEVRGTAKLPLDWNLVVLVQSPQDQRYYYQGNGSIFVDGQHNWQVMVTIGSSSPGARASELNSDYKVYALIVDEQGQQQVEATLGKQWTASLPHSATMAVIKVHL
jgi:hypothetical protein